jgi:hypothetical protein
VRCESEDDLKCAECSGDSYVVDGICREPQRVVASEGSFAYIANKHRHFGTLSTQVRVWGHYGKKSSRMSGQIEESGQFYPSESAEGFEYSSSQNKLAENTKNVASLYSTDRAFAALHTDGSVTAWGYPTWGGQIPDSLQKELNKEGVFVRAVYSNRRAFAILCTNGQVFTWGSGSSERGDDYGGRVKELCKPYCCNVILLHSLYLLAIAIDILTQLNVFFLLLFFSLFSFSLQILISKHNLLTSFSWCQIQHHFLR